MDDGNPSRDSSLPPSSGSEPRKVPVRPASESRDRDRSGSPFKRQASLLEEAPAAAIPESSTQINADPEDTQPTKQLSQSKPQPSQPKALQLQARTHTKTPEPRFSKERINNQHLAERSPSTPGHLAPFDWEDFETRYEQALRDATEREVEHLEEFENLVKYFHVWASSASVNDNERGMKRLQTRERYVRLQERQLQQRKNHLAEVVRAFQSALALLNQT